MDRTRLHNLTDNLVLFVLADRVKPPGPPGTLGLDRNVGQVTDRDGRVHPLSGTSQLDANIKRKEREVAREPGKNVKRKASLNREILKSNRGRLGRQLAYKAGELLKVDSAYTSQTCVVCQHVD